MRKYILSLPYMVGVCCALMVGTLVSEYVQLTYLSYPTENTEPFQAMQAIERNIEKWKRDSYEQTISKNLIQHIYRSNILRDDDNISKTALIHRGNPAKQTLEINTPSSIWPISSSQTMFDLRRTIGATTPRGIVQPYQSIRPQNSEERVKSLNEEVHIARYINNIIPGGYDSDISEERAMIERIGRKIRQNKEVQRYGQDVEKNNVSSNYALAKKRWKQSYQSKAKANLANHRWQNHSSLVQRTNNVLDELRKNELHHTFYTVNKSVNAHGRKRQWIPHFRKVTISENLFKLQGVHIPYSPTPSERGWQTWTNTAELNHKLLYLDKAFAQMGEGKGEQIPYSRIHMSRNPNIVTRGEFQQTQVNIFCQKMELASILPSNPEDLSILLNHLLYDDSKRLIFCYVPKNGCSNMKRLLLILNGILPPESAQQNRPAEHVLREVKSFNNLTIPEVVHKLKNYYKIAIVRHPFERLLSAYKNKLEQPFVSDRRGSFQTNIKLFIFNKFQHEEYRAWLNSQNDTINPSYSDIHLTFEAFVQYMNSFPLTDYNEHFIPFLKLCHPCTIHYDFYPNFKTLQYDLFAVMKYLNISSSYYSSVTVSHSTHLLMKEYYDQLSSASRLQLLERFHQELEFFYSLYPEERNSHPFLQ